MTQASIVALAVGGARWWDTWPEYAAAGVALAVLALVAVVDGVAYAALLTTAAKPAEPTATIDRPSPR